MENAGLERREGWVRGEEDLQVFAHHGKASTVLSERLFQ